MSAQPISSLELFSSYTVIVEFERDGLAHVTKVIELGNNADKPIVPGIVYLGLSKKESGWLPFGRGKTAIQEISNIEVHDTEGTAIETKVALTENQTLVSYSLWAPISPGETSSVIMRYDTRDLISEGLLFDTAVVPGISSSFPIEAGGVSLRVILPQGKHATYAPGFIVTEENGRDVLSAKVSGDAVFEFSPIPFPILPFRWSITFWLLILLLALLISARARRRKMGSSSPS